ncbi:hypothetical protein [Diaminobutyricibacter sp. McL0608]|uniref:hypothetical protein n=1 Tax=Leifsonia sp. McL0608 TaxID=3143537 RepID=UPI0031F32B59
MSDARATDPETVSGEPLDTDPVKDEKAERESDDEPGDILPETSGDPANWAESVEEDRDLP